MDVDRYTVHRPLVGKYLHAVDQRDDAVGLVADQPRQRPVLVGNRRFQQLGGATNTGQRILDLMRQHRGKAGDRTGRRAMGQLPVDLVGHRPFLKDDDDRSRFADNRRNVKVDQLVLSETRRT